MIRRTAHSLSLFLAFLLAIALLQSVGQDLQGSQNKRSLELTGRWLTEDGRQVIIEQSGNHVHATFAPEDDQCTNGATLEFLLEADLSGVKQETEADYPKTQASLTGKMAACTDPKLLADCPNLSKVWETTFEGTAAPGVLSGDAFIEGIDQTCNANHQFDTHQPFTLTACEDVNMMPGDPVITPDSNTKVRVRVTCHGAPVEGAKVDFEIEPQDSTGGHIHVKKRPKGKLNGKDLTNANPRITLATDQNGEVKESKGVTFAPPGKTPDTRCVGIAGDYKVTARSYRVPDRKDSTMIEVGFQNLTFLPQSQNYDICADSKYKCPQFGAWGTTSHPDSENGTVGTITAFQNVATDFLNWWQTQSQALKRCGQKPWPPQKVSFNDIALPWGGLFDMNDTWENPHKTHGKGQGGDFNHLHGNCPRGGCLYCDGTRANYDTVLWSVLKDVADPKYGQWDTEVNRGGELHLHVEDRGVLAPHECPADD